MNKNTEIVKKEAVFKELESKYPYFKQNSINRVNIHIFNYLTLFSNDRNLLAASLVQNPFGKTISLKEIRAAFGNEVHEIISRLNRLHRANSNDSEIFKNYNEWRQSIILYLINYIIFFENFPRNKEAYQLKNKKKIKFAMKLLENLDVTEIRMKLEDNFFSIIDPKTYDNYQSLLKFTRKKFLIKQEKVIKDLEKILKKAKIKARIESRIKTIYSIHHKILKKNILFSQILDTIGIRILLENEEDCYRSMVLILKKSPIMTSLVKDYIAIPKENGYQSIHLTIIYEDYPVEIQIRTHQMHQNAQYGTASHFEYKKKSD